MAYAINLMTLPFHMGLYFQKVPTVNPSVKNQRFLPAPFGKGAFGAVPIPGAGGAVGAKTKAPLAKGGCLGLPRRGDSPGEAWELLTDYLFTIH